MALIECPECKGKVSDKAQNCPHCGYPMIDILNTKEDIQKTKAVYDDMIMYYCPKCGRTITEVVALPIQICDVCNTRMSLVPSTYMKNFSLRDMKEWSNTIYRDLVKPSPEFDKYLFDHREEIRSKAKVEAIAKDSNKPKCPTCGSFRVHRYRGSFFDFRSYECRDCGYKW